MNRPSLFDPMQKERIGARGLGKDTLTVPTASAMSKAATHAMAEAVAYVVAAAMPIPMPWKPPPPKWPTPTML